jgi:hypothetical protein
MNRVNSVFALAVADIVDGKLPLYGQLSRSQRRKGETDCAVPFIGGEEFRNILGLMLLRGGKVQLAASFQENVNVEWMGKRHSTFTSRPIEDQGVEAFLSAMERQLAGAESGLTMLNDRTMAGALVRAFDSRNATL